MPSRANSALHMMCAMQIQALIFTLGLISIEQRIQSLQALGCFKTGIPKKIQVNMRKMKIRKYRHITQIK